MAMLPWLALAFSLPSVVQAAPEVARALREPVRLTAGASQEFMGVCSPDEAALYFVSDRSGTLDIMLQSPMYGAPEPLSAGLGDAAWPRVAPDGKHIAYISFERDATGDVCVRPVQEPPQMDPEAASETCLTDSSSAELQLLWWDNASLAVLSRRDLHGGFRLLRLPIDGSPPRLLFERNMVGLAISPDRQWLAYIPIEQPNPEVGVTFSNRVAQGLRLQRLGAPSAAPAVRTETTPLAYTPPLPGVTGYVAFSKDGKYLLFTQFLNDTNRDGAIDGDDNAVIFRVAFAGTASQPIDPGQEPEQLTSARWDCQYPEPATSRLIASCSHDGSLDVYALPLEGAVPPAWGQARLLGEMAVARDLWTQLLLAAHRLAQAKDAAAKDAVLLQMVALHLELREYEAAIYYAENRFSGDQTRRVAQVLGELARHRRADLALIHGQLSDAYVRSEQARATRLRALVEDAPAKLLALLRLALSEIEDDSGDKASALATFRELDLRQLDDPLLAALAARRAERLYRLRGNRQNLLEVYRVLSGLPGLDVAERLKYAQDFVTELRRGRSKGASAAAIEAWRKQIDDQSELALMLDVERALLSLDDESQEAVRAEIFELYKKNKDLNRRRALVLATLSAAARVGNEYVQYQFANSWASWLRPDHPERKYAEALYRKVVLDRAYGEGRQGKLAEARAYFYGVTLSTQSLQAHIGFIEARLAEGGDKPDEALDEIYRQRFARTPDSPEYDFVKAYRIARQLPRQSDPEQHEDSVAQVEAYLAKVDEALPRNAEVHQLWGFALHQHARRSGSRQAAVAANRQYLLALDLARDDPRLTAALLHRLGLLQASLGSHGAALRYLLQRDRLPHVRPRAELGLRVAIAHSAWHVGDNALAQTQLLAAEKLIDATPSLARFRPLVVDRLALCLTTAGQAPAAQQRYEQLQALLEGDPDATPLNRLKAKVGLAANALPRDQARKALRSLSEAQAILDAGGELTPHTGPVFRRRLTDDYRYSRLQYQALVAGLQAGAERALGNLPAALAATQRRVAFLERCLNKSEVDEDRLELAQAYLHLGQLHYRLKDLQAAQAALEHGLQLSASFNANTGSEVNEVELALIAAYAELHLYGGIRLQQLQLDLPKQLAHAYAVICKYRSPRWAPQRFIFETYLTRLALGRSRPTLTGSELSDTGSDL